MRVIQGDCLEVLKILPNNSVDSVVTDPPGQFRFMNVSWDEEPPEGSTQWLTQIFAECLRVLKPGGHALVWALPRLSYKTGQALDNAGFEVRDCITHLFGTGFPKSLSISKAIDREAGAERPILGEHPQPAGNKAGSASYMMGVNGMPETAMITGNATDEAKKWNGWGTAIKPASEHWWLCRKPLAEGTVASNVVKHGTGGLNIDACRIQADDHDKLVKNWTNRKTPSGFAGGLFDGGEQSAEAQQQGAPTGRFPANVVLTHHDECADQCDENCPIRMLNEQTGQLGKSTGTSRGSVDNVVYGKYNKLDKTQCGYGDRGGASRFFATFKRTECGSKSTKADDTSVGKNQVASGDSVLRTDMYGRSISDQFRMGTIYITRTSTHSTMMFPISNASSLENTHSCTITCEGTLNSSMELSTKSVSIVSSTEALITFDGGATQVIKGTVTIAPVNNTQNTALNICATGEPRIGNITLPGAEKITPKMNASTLSAGPDIRRRFFYTAKASKADKSAGDLKNTHPTVKSTQLMRYLIRLITPPGGVVLDPFGGSGSTGVAAGEEGMDCIMIEMQPEYVEIAKKRLGLTEGAADATV